MARLSELTEKYEQLSAYTDFCKAALAIMATNFLPEAAATARAAGFNAKVCDVLHKAATGAVTTEGSGISGYLGPLLPAFMAQVASAGVFDAVAASALQLPLHIGRIVIASSRGPKRGTCQRHGL